MNPSPAHTSESTRLSALTKLNILDTDPEQDFDDITRLAAQICDTPVSLITLVDEKRQWFKSRQGITLQETARDISFCTHTIRQTGILLIPDTLSDDRVRSNPMVTGEPFVRFYAGVPIISEDGHGLGTLCIIDYKPRRLTSQQVFTLEVLARQVQSLLKLRSRIIAQQANGEEAD